MAKYLIALDDGHGMETAGKRTPTLPNGLKSETGNFMHENEFNRAVVKKLDVILKACGMDTLFTAPTDKDTPLKERSALANLKGATILVSVHANALDGSFDNPDPDGVETFYYPGSVEGKKLAQAIQKYLILGTDQTNRGVKSQNLHMIRETNMPAVLVEAGFMDNLKEAKLLLSDSFRQEVALEIAGGICEYLKVTFVNPYLKKEPAKSSKLYRVQVGAFSVKQNAINLKERLIKLGFKDAFIQ